MLKSIIRTIKPILSRYGYLLGGKTNCDSQPLD